MELFRQRLRDAVREVCKKEHITQENLADELGIERTTFRNYWTRQTKIPIERLRQIFDRLNLDANYMIGRDSSREWPKEDPLEQINRKLDRALKD